MVTPTPAPGEDRSLALALVNTELESRSGLVDLIADGPAAAAWLRQHAGADLEQISDRDARQVRDLRAAVRAAFAARIAGAAPDPPSLAALNAAAAAAPRAPQVTWTAEGPQHAWASPASRGIRIAEAAIAADAIDVLTGPLASTLRSCDAHGCMRIFLQDHGRRRWCSTACGDRVRVARHYAKTRDAHV